MWHPSTWRVDTRCVIFEYRFSGDVVREEKEILSVLVCQKKRKEGEERFSKRLGSKIGGKRKRLVLLPRWMATRWKQQSKRAEADKRKPLENTVTRNRRKSRWTPLKRFNQKVISCLLTLELWPRTCKKRCIDQSYFPPSRKVCVCSFFFRLCRLKKRKNVKPQPKRKPFSQTEQGRTSGR